LVTYHAQLLLSWIPLAEHVAIDVVARVGNDCDDDGYVNADGSDYSDWILGDNSLFYNFHCHQILIK
jgi:hypothetical protein